MDSKYFDFFSYNKETIKLGVLMGVVSIGLFDLLENQFLSIPEILLKLNLKCEERELSDILEFLTVTEYLEKNSSKENFPAYKTKNTIYSKSNHDNEISTINYFYRLFHKILLFPSYLNEGTFPNSFDKEKAITEEVLKVQQNKEDFIRLMAISQENSFDKVVNNFDFSKYNTILDVGGGSGMLCAKIKKMVSDVNCINFDLEIINQHSKVYLKDHGLENIINHYSGDVFVTDWPSADVIIMSMFLHDFEHNKKEFLFNKAYEKLNENGLLMIIEPIIDESEKSGENYYESLIYAAKLRINEGKGFYMTPLEVKNYSQAAKFKALNIVNELGIVLCHK
jgi:cyclopropane fatty-acyl-phospholipid synthase-like methyltransferase